ncbi:MAG: DUF4381 family protein, partial [Phycisphaerae bacterium]
GRAKRHQPRSAALGQHAQIPSSPVRAIQAAIFKNQRSRDANHLHQSGNVVRLAIITMILFLTGFLTSAGCNGKSNPDAAESVPTTTPTSQPVERSAERGPMQVTVIADRDQVTSPDPVSLTIHVAVESGVEVRVPKLEGIVGPFSIVDVKERVPDCGVYVECHEWVYTLESVLPGDHEIPTLKFSFHDARQKADGSDDVYEDEVTLDPIPITVTQTLADVKGPVSLPMPFRYKLLWWSLGVVAAMVAIALAVRWWRRRQTRPEALPWADRIPPHVWALEELDRLASEDLIGRGQIQEFYYRINGLLRRYIELRFSLMAGEQTSEEFIRALQDSNFLRGDHKSMLREFVDACDPVKYARQQPGVDEIDWVRTSARAFVEQTADTLAEHASTGARSKQETAA